MADASPLLEVSDVRLVASDDTTRPTAIFMALKNTGAQDDRLMSVSSPLCGRAEIHDHIMTDEVMQMRQVTGGVALPAGANIVFKPMGLHVMCFEPVMPQKLGDAFSLSLSLEKAGEVQASGQILNMADAMRGNTEPDAPTPAHHH